MKARNQTLNRRQFLEESVRDVGALALGGVAMTAARSAFAAGAQKSVNPFAYDVDRLAKTDSRLIHYDQVGRFASPNPEPHRIAWGPGDRLYIAGKNGVSVLDREGNRIGDLPLAEPARCVAVASDGTVYVGARDHVEVFDRKGQRQSAWEPAGKKTWLSGLVVSETDVFVADSGSRMVLRYDRSGKLVGRLGEKNKDRNVPGLIVPSPYLDVDLAKDGLLRVNNPGRHRVEGYTVNGDLEFSWGKPSVGIAGFCGCCNPIGLTCLPDGRCITAEKGLPRVKVYSTEGAFESVVAGPESFPEQARAGSVRDLSDCSMGGLDVAVDLAGRVYILDLVTADVLVMKRKA